jgi:uncharacterized membrane protein
MSHSDGTPASRRLPQSSPPTPLPQKPADPPREDATDLEPAIEILRPLLKNPDQAQQVVTRVATAVLFQGPLPPPDVFKGYEEVVPGSALEILKMATREQGHRHKLQFLEMIYPYLGWLAGFVCFIASIAGAIYLAMHDRETVASLLLGCSVPRRNRLVY